MCLFGYTRLLSPISYGKKLLLPPFVYFFAFLPISLLFPDHLQDILERDIDLQCIPLCTMLSSKRGLHARHSSHTLYIKYTRFSLSLSSHSRHRYTGNFSPSVSLLGCREGVDGTRSRRLREEVVRTNLRVKTVYSEPTDMVFTESEQKRMRQQCKLVMII